MITLTQCQYLIEISRHDSMNQAANALFITQPTLSKVVKDLEKELNITILERTNKGVTFTSDGKELLFYASLLLEQADTLEKHFNHEESLQIDLSSQYYGFISDAIVLFMNNHKDLKYKITLNEGNAGSILENIINGKSVVGIIFINDYNRDYYDKYLTSYDLDFHVLKELPISVFMREDHILKEKTSITIEDLLPYPYLTYHDDDLPLYLGERYIDESLFERIVYIKDRGTMNNLLAHSDGFNIGTGYITSDMNHIISIPFDNKQMKLGYIIKKNQLLNKEMKELIGYIKERLK